jgi:hypothetical protein
MTKSEQVLFFFLFFPQISFNLHCQPCYCCSHSFGQTFQAHTMGSLLAIHSYSHSANLAQSCPFSCQGHQGQGPAATRRQDWDVSQAGSGTHVLSCHHHLPSATVQRTDTQAFNGFFCSTLSSAVQTGVCG